MEEAEKKIKIRKRRTLKIKRRIKKIRFRERKYNIKAMRKQAYNFSVGMNCALCKGFTTADEFFDFMDNGGLADCDRHCIEQFMQGKYADLMLQFFEVLPEKERLNQWRSMFKK